MDAVNTVWLRSEVFGGGDVGMISAPRSDFYPLDARLVETLDWVSSPKWSITRNGATLVK